MAADRVKRSHGEVVTSKYHVSVKIYSNYLYCHKVLSVFLISSVTKLSNLE